jgi:hypothetical protein
MAVTYEYYEDSTGQWWELSVNPDGSANTTQVPPQGSSMAITYSYFEDADGNFWAFSINPDGSANTSPVSAPTPGPTPAIVLPNINCTLTLLDTMEWAKKYMSNRSTAIGNYLEPALTSANMVMQTILDAPFRWRWNREVTGFVTTPGQQDYYLFNWMPLTPVGLNWVLVDYYGNCQMCSKAGTTGVALPAWAFTEGQTTNDGTGSTYASWTNVGSIGVPVSTTYDMGWIETVSVQDQNQKWWEMENKICLSSDSSNARPKFIAGQGDDNSGNILFRLMPVPDQAYPIAITLQTWAPIPDYFSSIYNWGFLSLMLLFADDPRFTIANGKFISSILSTAQGLDETEINIFLNNWAEITGAPISKAAMMQSGMQARNQAGG